MKASFKVGDVVLIWAGPGIPTAPAIPIGARVVQTEGQFWVDLCMLGQHLPQMYKPGECEPMTADLAAKHGLCTDCLGYGTTGDVPIAAGLDQVPNPCPRCTGTGRVPLRVQIKRTPSSTEASMTVEPHEPLEVVGFVGCVACGFPLEGPEAAIANHVPPTTFKA